MLAIHDHKALCRRTTRKRPSLRYRERAERPAYANIKPVLSPNHGILAVSDLTTRNIYERFSTHAIHVNAIATVRHSSDEGCMETDRSNIAIDGILKTAYAAVGADIIQTDGLWGSISRAR